MYTSSAAANSENAEPSSASSRLNASQAKPAPSAKAVMCTTRKNSVGRSLIQRPQGISSSLSFGVGGVGVAAGTVLTSLPDVLPDPGAPAQMHQRTANVRTDARVTRTT